MRQVIAYELGVKIAQFPACDSVQAACAKWCELHTARVLCTESRCYGLAVVTVAMQDQTRRQLEFVLAVG